ncbi:GD18081 [Drosophila simulans]|uniref:GD18081 n=1 Tax=Drosophila simulans TaxID=7240 RepID=B4QXG1_DROSI|nr:GD18081 [Drosophila simulans]
MSDAAAMASSDEEGLPAGSTSGRQRVQRDYSDARLDRVAAYTTTTMRLKPDKWTKMMACDDLRRIVVEWQHGHSRVLVMTLSPGGDLVPRSCLSDLYLPYSVQSARGSVPSAMLPAEDEAMATVTAAVSAVVSVTPGALLIPLPPASSSFTTLDGVPRGKCAYFVRRNTSDGPLTASNFAESVLYGDFPVHSKIETMSLLFDDVLQPLLEQAQSQWPAIVRKDLQARIKEVRNTLTEIKGKTNNRTILSLLVSPTIVEECLPTHLRPALDPKFRNLLEEMFINWTTQMHDIVLEHSECQPLGSATQSPGNQPKYITLVSLPAQEIGFWTNRKLNLQNIYEQLRESTHKTLAQILERIESVYYEPYATAFRKLVAAWLEAQDVSLWLQPLLRQTAAFNSVQFSNGHDLVAPLVHIVHLVWSNARYYRSTQRMSVLLRCICNMLVHRAAEDLELQLLFQGDADEGLLKINRTTEVLELFKQRMLDYKERYAGSQVLLPALPEGAAAVASSPSPDDQQQLWRFCHEDVFGQTLDGFSLQLLELRQVFEAAVQFQQLEKLEVGGLRGKLLTELVRETHISHIEHVSIARPTWKLVLRRPRRL